MTINRNFLFLEAFSVILIISVFGNIQEFVATLISNHPNDYLGYLLGYIIIISILLFVIYKVTYKPPKYEKIVNKAQQRQTDIIDGLKTKIETIDDKQRKKQEKKHKKTLQNAQKEEKKAQKQTHTNTSLSSTLSKSSKVTPSSKPTSKPKSTRRRR